MLRSLDISKSAGEDKISGKFLRDAAEVISSPLTYITLPKSQIYECPNAF